jgi:hypothetical protein
MVHRMLKIAKDHEYIVKDQMDKLKDGVRRGSRICTRHSTIRWIWRKKQRPRSATIRNEVCADGLDILQVSPDDWCFVCCYLSGGLVVAMSRTC